MKFRRRLLAGMCPILASIFGLFCVTNASAGIEIFVESGDALPGGGGQFSDLFEPALNDNGQFSFLARLTDSNGAPTNDVGVYRGDVTGAVAEIARSGQPFAGAPISGFWAPNLDASGNVFGRAAVGVGGAQYFLGQGGTLSEPIAVGSSSPSGGTLNDLFAATTNASGTILARARYLEAGNLVTGVYERSVGGTLTARMIVGDSLPGGGELNGFSSLPSLNESGQLASLSNVSENGEFNWAVHRVDGTSVTELAREGMQLPDGTQIVELPGPFSADAQINDGGDVAFVAARYVRPGEFGTGVFLNKGGTTSLIASDNLAGAAGTFDDETELIGIADDGAVGIFQTGAIHVADNNGVSLVALKNDPTPDGNTLFARFYRTTVGMNNAGQIVFSADLYDAPNSFPATGRGVYIYDNVNGLQEILRTGDTLGGNTIEGAYFVGSSVDEDNTHSGLNEAGQIGIAYTLTNGGSGIALWTPDSQLSCDFDADGDCEQDDIDAFYAPEDRTLAEIIDWLAAASSPNNLTNPGGDTFLMGDLDLDGHVNSIDLGNLLNNFNSSDSRPWRLGNLNDDTFVDSLDLGLLLNHFDSNTALSNAVPEPDRLPWVVLATVWAFVGILRRRF